MLKVTPATGQPPSDDNPAEPRAGSHVVEDIAAASRRVETEDASGAALRSILIGAVLVGGLTWLARVTLQRMAKGRERNSGS